MGSYPELIEFTKTKIVRQYPDIFDALQPVDMYKIKFLYPRGVGVDPHEAQTIIREETAKSNQYTLYRLETKSGYIVAEFEEL